ncbi:MAG: UDP-N-acetylmuramoyl-L-alanyl-D-glutamate--2,6-diaminopimelate ligase, partial [Candidatus Binatia bacterium]
MILRDLLRELTEPPLRVAGDVERDISALVSDSRRAKEGALFFALPGTRTDGRRFVADAVAKGAVGVVAEGWVEGADAIARIEVASVHRSMSEIAAAFFGRPSRALELVGVTGTNGKTTVTWLLESIWRSAGRNPGVIGTIEYRLGDRTWPAAFTTPQAIELQELLAEMLRAGATSVVMEASSHALALDRVRDCEWDGAIFTNLSRDHLDFHPDMESYFGAKARLFSELLPRSSKRDRFAVIHRDDPWGLRLIGQVRERVVTFGRTPEADVAPEDAERSLEGWRGRLRVGSERLELRSSLVGEAHLDNILAAAAAAAAQGIAPAAIAGGIEACRGIPGRMERVDGRAPFAVFVDYAHTPDALERSLKALRDLCAGRLLVVFGCGGDRDR